MPGRATMVIAACLCAALGVTGPSFGNVSFTRVVFERPERLPLQVAAG
jgi:hypothetical protein